MKRYRMRRKIDWLRYQGEQKPDAPAVRTVDHRLNFLDLNTEVDNIAAKLITVGVTPGMHVGVCAANSLDTLLLYYALIRLACVSVPIHIRLTIEEKLNQAGFSDCAFLFTDDGNYVAGSGEISIPVYKISEIRRFNPAGSIPEQEFRSDRTSVLMFTSGTTGEPKAVELSLDNFLFSALGSMLRLGLMPGDNWLLSLPLYHIGGFSILTRSLIYGIPLLIPESLDTKDLAAAIAKFDPTHISLVPTMLSRLIESGAQPNPSQRVVLLGGGPIDSSFYRSCKDKGWAIVSTYGATETCSQSATADPDEHRDEPGGYPLAFTEIIIIDEKGDRVPVGSIGQIVVNGPAVSKGYYKRDDLNKSVLRGNKFRSGDLGVIEKQGRLRVISRRTDLIISGGENINPVEVEVALRVHESVRDACVFPIDDERWGQIAVAAIVPRSGSSMESEKLSDTLRTYLKGKIPGYKIPKKFFYLDALPYSATGKLNREEVKEIYLSRS
jgi:o-succinylbenzoate---CoA ligase